MIQRSAHVHAGFVLLSVGLGVVLALSPGVVELGAVVAAGLLPTVLLLAMLVGRRIAAPTPWWIVLGGLTSLTVYNVEVLRQVGLSGQPVAEGALVLVTLPLGYLGLLTASFLVVFRYAREDTGGIADAVLVALAAAGLAWVLALSPALREQGADAGERLYTLTLILLVAGIAGAVVRAITTSRAARPALTYFLVGVLAALVGNVTKVLSVDPATGAASRWVGAVWVLGFLALAAAVAHPAHRHLSTPDHLVRNRLSRGRLVFLGSALALNPTLVGLQALLGHWVDVSLLVVGSLLMATLVMLRIAQLARLHADAETKLARLATHDVLTDLPNRRGIDQHLEHALVRLAAGRSAGVVVLFLDLDNFKAVNDEHGHPLGDRLLVTVARRLRAVVRDTDLVGRFGGDEFVVVLEGDPDVVLDEAVLRIEEALRHPVRLDDVLASATASIGAGVVRPGDDVRAEKVLSAADARMYEHKRALRATR